MTRSDFFRLLSATRILVANGDTSWAKALIDAAAALVATGDAGFCGKCIKRRQAAVEALHQVKALSHLANEEARAANTV